MELTTRVRAAHGDVWQVEGAIRADSGGGAAELPGIRLMASGLPFPQWNNGDVHDASAVDIQTVAAWYAGFGVGWGVRVPVGMPWSHGRFLFRKRCMALLRDDFRAASEVPGLAIRPISPTDLDAAAAVDASAFGDPVDATRAWLAPQVAAESCRPLLALVAGEPVGVATGVRASGWAGETVGVFGVGVLPAFRGRGIGAALTATACAWGFGTGADLAHLNPDTDDAARLYARLGFVETGGFDVYVMA